MNLANNHALDFGYDALLVKGAFIGLPPKGTKTPIGVLSSPFARVGRSRNDQLMGEGPRFCLSFTSSSFGRCSERFFPGPSSTWPPRPSFSFFATNSTSCAARLGDRNFAVWIASCLPPQAVRSPRHPGASSSSRPKRSCADIANSFEGNGLTGIEDKVDCRSRLTCVSSSSILQKTIPGGDAFGSEEN